MSYQVSTRSVARYLGGQPLCLAAQGLGRSYLLRAERPGVGAVAPVEAPSVTAAPVLVRVEIFGVLEQRATAHACGGWTDGHDAIAERMIEALEHGDVLMVIDSPGGAAAGCAEAVRRVREAKTARGRRVYAYADELAASAGYWWACVADEVFVPSAGVVGSIGVRGGHASIAGALEQDGVEVTLFAWPPGKVALAAEKPLTDVGRERAERDVAIIGEAFAAAVTEARGLPLEAIVALDADCLTGADAVEAGLADDVASLEDVIEYALARAQETHTP